MTSTQHHDIPFLDALRADLLSADVPERRRPGARGIAVLSVMLVLVVIAVGLAVSRPTPASAAIIVKRTGNHVEIRVVHGGATVGQANAAFRSANVPMDIRAVPTGPSRVGDVLGIALRPGQPVTDNTKDTLRFDIEEGFRGRLYLGTPAGDKPYQRPTDAFAKQEPLAGSCLLGAPVSQAAEWLADHEISARWSENGVVAERVPEQGWVAGARAYSPDDVVVQVSDVRPAVPPGCTD